MNLKINNLIDVWKSARERGIQLSAEDLCRDCPELLNEVRAKLHALDASSTDEKSEETKSFQADDGLENAPTSYLKQTNSGASSEWPHIKGYRLERELGRGGMGIVYLATDVALQRPVAIKLSLTQAKATAQSRFQTEASALARLHHPHIIQVHASGATQNGQTYFVMEYMAEGSLADRVGKVPQPIVESARLVQLLAKAVHAAHQRGIIHRDLKPANVLLAPSGDEPALNCAWGIPKIADFGVVKIMNESPDEQATRTGDLLGTPHYMAPEQARSGKTIGPPADIYALGAILYSLLAGHPPFHGGTSIDVILRVQQEPPTPLRGVRPEIPKTLDAICLKCLEKDLTARYGSAAELAEALQSFLMEGKVKAAKSLSDDSANDTHIPVVYQRKESKKFGIVAIGVFLGVLIALFVHFQLNNRIDTRHDSIALTSAPAKSEHQPSDTTSTFVLGKNVNDPDFAAFLNANLDRIIAETNQPTEFTRSMRELEKVPDRLITSKLLAFRAECMLEGERKDISQAEDCVKKTSIFKETPAYAHYVHARLWHEEHDSDRAVRSLVESLKQGYTLVGFRRDRALRIFEEAAKRINIVTDARKLSASIDGAAPDWLTAAEVYMGDSKQSPNLSILIEFNHPVPRNTGKLQTALSQAAGSEWSKKPQWPVLFASLKLKLAESAVQAKQETMALSVYAECWDYVSQHREAFTATSPLTLYERILAPAQNAANFVKPSSERNTQLASILAAYAGLIFESPYEAWPRPANQLALRLAADAYGEAAKLYPGTGRIKAEFLTGQGKCLNRMGSVDPADIAAISANAKAATSEDPTFAGGWNILGLARYYRLAQETSEADVRKTLGESIDAYDKAILLAKEANPADKEIAQYFSNRSLARSMMGDFTSVENNERRNVYQKAIDDALAATQIDANYELAWESLGQSRERLADLLKGEPANSIFSDAVTAYGKLLDARPSLPKGHTYLGRCYIRWGLSENKDATKLYKGKEELNKAIKLNKDMAEAHFWLGRYYLAKDDTSPAIESFIQASEHRELGLNYLTNTMNLLAKQPDVLMMFLNRYLPENLAQADARQANALLVRSRLERDSVKGNPKTPWAEAQPILDRAITDAQNALRLIPSTQLRQRAEAQETIAATRLKLFNFVEDAAIQTQYRTAMMDDIRSLLKTEQPTQNSWLLAKLLANFLEQDAVNASEDQGKKLREEAIKALDIALVQAPQSEKEQLRRTKSDIERKLR